MSETVGLSRKTFSFFWTIENMDLFFQKDEVYSSRFCAQPLDSSMWYLILRKENPDHYTEIKLQCLSDENTTEGNRFECEISLIKSDSSSFLTVDGQRQILQQGGFSFPLLKLEDFYNLQDELYPEGTFTVCCRLWRFGTGFQGSNLIYGLTSLRHDFDSFIWSVRNFSSLEPGQTRSRRVKLNFKSYPSVTLNLFLGEDDVDEVHIEIGNCYSKMEILTHWRVSVVDIHGRVLHRKRINWNDGENKNSITLKRFMMKSRAIAERASCLLNNTLILAFDCILEQKSMNVFDFLGQDNIQENPHDSNSKEALLPKSGTKNLSSDLMNLYKENAFTDINLKAGSETFPAHIAVLSARSSVFKSMFTVNTKAKCIELEDIEPKTLHQLLLYIYTNSIDDLQYETAAALYSAAEKYHMVTLRRKCSKILKNKISIANAGEMLILADKHSDEDLKSYAESFFLDQRLEIFQSADWTNFKKNHPSTALEIMQNVLLKIM